MRRAARLFILLAFVTVSFGCKSIIRTLFYPPEVDMQGGLGPDVPGNSYDHSTFSILLGKYVDDKGLVSYAGFKNDQKTLDAYLQALAVTQSERLSRYEQLAFYINAYNALTIRLILDNPDIASIRDIPAHERWKGRKWMVASESVTLDDIEHKIIRPRFKENRVHFALVCASIGCPPLRKEGYSGKQLLHQLDNQARRFFAEPRNFSWDSETKTLWVSSILDWYAGDFGGEIHLQNFVSRYASNFFSALQQGKARIDFLSYDWNLNIR